MGGKRNIRRGINRSFKSGFFKFRLHARPLKEWFSPEDLTTLSRLNLPQPSSLSSRFLHVWYFCSHDVSHSCSLSKSSANNKCTKKRHNPGKILLCVNFCPAHSRNLFPGSWCDTFWCIGCWRGAYSNCMKVINQASGVKSRGAKREQRVRERE